MLIFYATRTNKCIIFSTLFKSYNSWRLFTGRGFDWFFCYHGRWPSPNVSLVWWRRRTSWVCSVTARSPSSSSTAPTVCSSMPARIWTKCCWNTQSTVSRTRVALTPTSWRYAVNLGKGWQNFLLIKLLQYSFCKNEHQKKMFLK